MKRKKKTKSLPNMVSEFIKWRMLSATEETVRVYQWILDKYADYCFETNKHPLEPDTVHGFMLSRKRRGVKGGSLNSALVTIKGFFQHFIDKGELDNNPAALIPKFPEEAATIVGFKADEAKRLLKASKDHRSSHYWSPMIMLGWHYGMRIGDASHFKHEFVEWNEKQIRFIPRKKRRREILLPLVPDVDDALKHVPKADPVYFFPEAQTRYTFRGSLCPEFKSIVRSAGLNDRLTFHCLRHGAATRMLEAGVRLTTITEIIGWESTNMLRRYVDRDPTDISKALAGSLNV